MGARAVRSTSARGAEPLVDVLGHDVEGQDEDEPRRRPSRAQALAAAALALAGLAALLVPGSLTGDDARHAPTVDLALREGTAALPRRDAAPVQGVVHGGLHVEVVNEGREPVRLLAAALSPGAWQVAVVDDLDASADPEERGRLLRPGWVAMLVLHRSFRCAPGADHGPVPTLLTVEVEVGGRLHTSSLDLSDDRAADDGGLADVLGFPEQFCARGGTASAATVGDPGLPFLPLWPAGTGVLPTP